VTMMEAEDLAVFINRSSDRYSAETLKIGFGDNGEAWVILIDRAEAAAGGCRACLPPIVTVREMLTNGAPGAARGVEAECRALLESWLDDVEARCEDELLASRTTPGGSSATFWPSMQDARGGDPTPARGASRDAD